MNQLLHSPALAPLLSILVSLIIISQATVRYWRSPNHYRFSNWMTSVFITIGVNVLLLGPVVGLFLPGFPSPEVRLMIQYLFVACVMLAGYFAIVFCVDILNGYGSLRARQQRRQLGWYMGITLAWMILFVIRAELAGEREAANWFTADPRANGDLILANTAYLIYMTMVYLRLIVFSQVFLRITPVPSFKVGETLLIGAAVMGVISNVITAVALATPASSALAIWLWNLELLDLVLFFLCFYVGGRFAEKPTKRMQRLGAWLWSLRTVKRLTPMWEDLTHSIPQMIPPFETTWSVAVWRGEVNVMRDARIIEMLDVIHRLGLRIWSETQARTWLTSVNEVIRRPTAQRSPLQEAQEVQFHARHDAWAIIHAVRTYSPATPPIAINTQTSGEAILLHPPSFTVQEIHYLELVATAYQQWHDVALPHEAMTTPPKEVVSAAKGTLV